MDNNDANGSTPRHVGWYALLLILFIVGTLIFLRYLTKKYTNSNVNVLVATNTHKAQTYKTYHSQNAQFPFTFEYPDTWIEATDRTKIVNAASGSFASIYFSDDLQKTIVFISPLNLTETVVQNRALPNLKTFMEATLTLAHAKDPTDKVTTVVKELSNADAQARVKALDSRDGQLIGITGYQVKSNKLYSFSLNCGTPAEDCETTFTTMFDSLRIGS